MSQISYFKSRSDLVTLEELEGETWNLGKHFQWSGEIRMKLGG